MSCLVESSYILHKGSVCERLHDETIVNDSDASKVMKISVLVLSPVVSPCALPRTEGHCTERPRFHLTTLCNHAPVPSLMYTICQPHILHKKYNEKGKMIKTSVYIHMYI